MKTTAEGYTLPHHNTHNLATLMHLWFNFF